MRRLLAGLALTLAASGCDDEPSASAALPVAAAPEPASPAPDPDDPYRAFSFPPTHRAWTVVDFESLRDTLVAIDQSAPELFAGAGTAKPDVFAKLTSLENASAAFASAGDLAHQMALGEALGTITKVYATRAMAGCCGREYVGVVAVNLRIAMLQFAALVEGLALTEASLNRDRNRLEGLMKMRHGVRVSFAGLVQSPHDMPDVVDARDVVKALQPVAGEIATLLLSDEAATIRASIATLAERGAPADELAALDEAVAAVTRRHPLITAFADEHRAFSREQDALLAAVVGAAIAPLELGPELGGVRYSLPDRTISAVFDVRPNAQQQVTTDDGAKTTVRTLGIRDAVGFARSTVCIRRTPTKQDAAFAKSVLDRMGAVSVTAVKTSGHEGLEGVLEGDASHAIARVISLGDSGCIIVAEYPPRIAASAKPRARAFVDSVRLEAPTPD